MALIRVTEISDSGPGHVRENLGRDYERVFRVEFDAFNYSGAEAILCIPVRRGEVYVSPNGLFSDPMALAMEAQARREDEFSNFWIVTVPYSTKWWEEVAKALASGGSGNTGKTPTSPHSGAQDPSSPLNPLNRPWKISHGTTTIRRRLEKDWSSPAKAIANSIGDPIFYETEIKLRTITITRNVALPSIDTQLAWESLMNTKNNATFLGRTAGTVRCDEINGTTEYEENIAFFSQTMTFTVKPNLFGEPASKVWDLKLMDNGTHEYGLLGFRVPIFDASTGHSVTGPVPMNGAGKHLSESDIAAGNFHYLDFVEYPDGDFSILGLG